MSDAAPPPKFVPVVDEQSRPYFEGARRGELMLKHCAACGAWHWPNSLYVGAHRPRCVECFSPDISWRAASGRATLHTFAVMHQVYDPAFAGDVPYNIAVVDTEEGVRMAANIVGCANEDLHVGMALEVVFDQVSDEVAVVRFRPAGATAG